MALYNIYFSPTYQTSNITKLISDEIGDNIQIDLSLNVDEYSFNEDDICVVGVPSFSGRVPSLALKRMEGFKSNGSKTIIVVTYGNRAYEDTVKELEDFLNSKGFKVYGVITSIASHSIINDIAKDRPDSNDIKEIKSFTYKILDKINHNMEFKRLDLPGNYPYKQLKTSNLRPLVNDKCNGCMLCAKLCPNSAISLDNPKLINDELCISCMRCIKICPNNARYIDNILYENLSNKLHDLCNVDRKNELFI